MVAEAYVDAVRLPDLLCIDPLRIAAEQARGTHAVATEIEQSAAAERAVASQR
jgi:hypothetical protein